MSKLEQLIDELCPNGVGYKTLEEIAYIGTGSSNRVDAQKDGKYPFFVRSKQVMRSNSYCFDEEAIIAMYPTTEKKKNVPAFKILKDSKFWDFVEDDIVELTKTSKKITKKIIEQLK